VGSVKGLVELVFRTNLLSLLEYILIKAKFVGGLVLVGEELYKIEVTLCVKILEVVESLTNLLVVLHRSRLK
jgi:hypothetical protein